MTEHNSAEAFHNMQYSCDECGHSEMIWNSRDGVTPFLLSCSKCGKLMSHSGNWNIEKAYKTLPEDANRVFVAPFLKDAQTSASDWVERYYSELIKYGHYKNSTKEQIIANKVADRMLDQCPMVITRAQFLSGYHLS